MPSARRFAVLRGRASALEWRLNRRRVRDRLWGGLDGFLERAAGRYRRGRRDTGIASHIRKPFPRPSAGANLVGTKEQGRHLQTAEQADLAADGSVESPCRAEQLVGTDCARSRAGRDL